MYQGLHIRPLSRTSRGIHVDKGFKRRVGVIGIVGIAVLVPITIGLTSLGSSNQADKPSRCVALSPEELAHLAEGLTLEGRATLDSSYQVVIGEVGDQIRFVAAGLQVVGTESVGPVGVWAYLGGFPPLLVVSLNSEAEEFSHFIPVHRAGVQVGMGSDGAQEAWQCARDDFEV